MKLYLYSSAIVKRYVLEEVTEKVKDTHLEALRDTASLLFFVWNIGEVRGALHAYYRRKWLESEDYTTARESFKAKTTRLIKLGVPKVIPVRSKLLTQSGCCREVPYLRSRCTATSFGEKSRRGPASFRRPKIRST